MASTGFFLLSHEVGMHEQKGKWKHMKCIFGRRQSCSMFSSLSSRSTRQDIWSIEVSNSMWRQMNYSPCKCKIYIFKSFLMPDPISRIPPLKDITSFLTRSYNTLHEIPLLLQLAPAVGIIAFTVWGLRPLMRYSQNLFLHWNGNNSKKPESNYILSFYLHPLLLWIGATLICRALDPVILPSAASQGVKQRLLNFVKSLSTVLAFAYCLSSLIQQAQKFFMDAHDSTDTRNMGFQFAAKAVYTAVWVAAVSLFMELLGFSTQKWITAGGLGTLILTLAGREIFTNFLSSIMIHATRPFVLNEWIQTKIEGYEVSGTVEHVGWWSPTVIRGDDREAVHIPNHKFTVTVVRNLSQKTHWRIKTHLAISHLDVSKVNNIVADMRKVLAKNPQIEQQRLHRRVFLDNIDLENQALLIMISCFVKTSRFEEYLGVKEQVLLDLLRVIRHHRARLATPIRTIQRTSSDPDIENASFSDTIFTRARAATDRQFLLIEPPYKINGEDRMKTRPIRTGDEQVIKKSEMSDSRLATSEPNDVSGPVLDESEKRFKKEDSGGNVEIKNDNEKMSSASSPLTRPSLEDNIVLGVALDGSKRTLPIEEDDMSPSPPVESKDLTTCLNGSNIGGSQVSTKEKDGEMNTALGTVHSNSDQRDQER